MKMNEIISIIKSLAQSQGFYGRLLGYLISVKDNDPDKYNRIVEELEGQNFKDPVDMVLYFES